MAVKITLNSRLRFGELITLDGVEVWDLLDLPALPIRPDDETYVVQTGDRIDKIAFRFYGDPVLWWVIAVANDLEDIPTELSENQTLRIPSRAFVSQKLFQIAKVK